MDEFDQPEEEVPDPPVADEAEGLESFDTDPDLEEQMVNPNGDLDTDDESDTLNPLDMFETDETPGASNRDPGMDFLPADVPGSVAIEAFDPVFPMRLTGFTSATGGKWQERTASGTVMVDYVGGRSVSAITSAAGLALFGIAETDFISVRQVNPDADRYPAIPSGVVDCYLTTLADGTCDGYLDAAKTIKIFAAQSGNTASKGFARLVGKTWRFVGPAGDGKSFEVWLTQNGGANGSDGTSTAAAFPTYTYNVFTDAAKTIQIGTAVSVQFHRFLQCAVTAGGRGMAQWAGSTLHLLFTDEYWDRDTCVAQTTGMP